MPQVYALVVDGDEGVRAVVASELAEHGYDVVEAAGVATAVAALDTTAPSVVLLDVDLPGSEGFDALRMIRQATAAPLIVVTARGAETDRIAGLDLGADDYVVKPLSVGELMARIRAVRRRCRPAQAEGGLRFGDLLIDRRSREVRVGDVQLELTPREFDLLAYLAASPGQVFSREQLLDQVWGSSSDWQDAKTVTEHIRRLRVKLDAKDGADWIRTVHGVGYAFNPQNAG